MKSIFVLIGAFLLLILISCEERHQKEDSPLERQTEELIHKIKDGDLEILEIDGCEYLVYKEHISSNQGFGYLAHKGNCKNLIHCYNQIIESDSSAMDLSNKVMK